MKIDHVRAVVAVADLDVARDWYVRLLGREPDNHPMESLIEWRLTDHGWLQVTADPDRAGRSALNLAVADLAAARAEVLGRGIDAHEIQPVNQGVELCADRTRRQPDHPDRCVPRRLLSRPGRLRRRRD